MKGKINLHTKGTLKDTNKSRLYSCKILKDSSKIWKKLNFLSDIPNLSHIHQLSLTYISALYFTSTKNNILLLDPSHNENYVLFAPHKTTENAATFLTFTKNSHLK